MKQTSNRSKKPRPSQPRRAKGAAISAALESIDEVGAQTAKATQLIALLRSWLTDESGYDEKTWPKLKKALDQERRRVGARRLFGG